MPFGVSTTPAFFYYVINHLMGDMNMCIAVVYLDDINVVGCIHVVCWCNTMRVLAALTSSGMNVSAKKCHFCINCLVVLGYNLGAAAPNSKKLSNFRNLSLLNRLLSCSSYMVSYNISNHICYGIMIL